jgi:nucleoid-associated protein YgaU
MDRYANQKTVEVPHRNGANVRIVVRKPRPNTRQRFMTYTVTAADAMWTLAYRFLDEPLDWWYIAEMNWHIACPDELTYGTKMVIPVV